MYFNKNYLIYKGLVVFKITKYYLYNKIWKFLYFQPFLVNKTKITLVKFDQDYANIVRKIVRKN